MRGMANAPAHATTDFMSWRHVELFRYSDNLETVVPDVAKSWEWINDDYTELEISLRKGHKWSDGHPFTASDVVFWWEGIINNEELTPAIPSIYVFGGEPMSIEQVDETTFRVSFAAPAPNILSLWARNPWPPFAPEHYMTQFIPKFNPDAEKNAEADGYSWVDKFYTVWYQWSSLYGIDTPHLESYVIMSRDTEHRRYVPNPYYFKVDTAGQQLPYPNELNERFIPDVEVRNLAFINGEIDLRMQGVELTDFPVLKENESKGNYRIVTTPSENIGMQSYAWNQTSKDPILREIFSDLRWREAMSIAINREDINEAVYLGLGEPMQVIPVFSGFSWVKPEWLTKWTEYNPDRANQLLDEMGLEKDGDGWRTRPDGEPLVIYLQYAPQGGPTLIHELNAEFWGDVGVKVELKETTSEAYRTFASANDHDLATWRLSKITMVYLSSNPEKSKPVFGDRALSPFTGLPWLDWHESGGAEGEEPPEDIKRLQELADGWTSLLAGSDEWVAYGKEISEIHYENQYLFGIVGNFPFPTYVHNRVGNVPELSIKSSDYYWWFPFRVDQMYLKGE
jgi:peptide/nickel transport system substrate-binding protein